MSVIRAARAAIGTEGLQVHSGADYANRTHKLLSGAQPVYHCPKPALCIDMTAMSLYAVKSEQK